MDKEMWYIYTMEHYSVVKNNDIMKLKDKWMELDQNIPNKVTQAQKNKHSIFSLISDIWC